MLCNAGCAKDVSNKYGVTPVYEAALKGETESYHLLKIPIYGLFLGTHTKVTPKLNQCKEVPNELL